MEQALTSDGKYLPMAAEYYGYEDVLQVYVCENETGEQ
jgi:hypothetical protein